MAGQFAHVYTMDGTEILTVHSHQGAKLWDVACSRNKIYTTECGTDKGRVFVYDMHGRHLETFHVGYVGAAGLCLTETSILVTSEEEGVIYKMDMSDKVSKVLVEPTSPRGRYCLSDPFFVATDGKRIAATSSYNHRLFVYNMEGEQELVYGVQGSELNYPCGVVIDSSGNFIFSDGENHRIGVRSPFTDHLMTLDLKEQGLMHPAGLALTKDHCLVVACGYSGNDKAVAVFQYAV
jgi:outer membrane protein assembly factor BamB